MSEESCNSIMQLFDKGRPSRQYDSSAIAAVIQYPTDKDVLMIVLAEMCKVNCLLLEMVGTSWQNSHECTGFIHSIFHFSRMCSG